MLLTNNDTEYLIRPVADFRITFCFKFEFYCSTKTYKIVIHITTGIAVRILQVQVENFALVSVPILDTGICLGVSASLPKTPGSILVLCLQLQSSKKEGPSSLKSGTEHLIQRRDLQKDLAEHGNLVSMVTELKAVTWKVIYINNLFELRRSFDHCADLMS